jgi:hypothetical protein
MRDYNPWTAGFAWPRFSLRTIVTVMFAAAGTSKFGVEGFYFGLTAGTHLPLGHAMIRYGVDVLNKNESLHFGALFVLILGIVFFAASTLIVAGIAFA